MSRARPSATSRSRPAIEVGQIVGPHGLKGHVKVEPYTDLEDYFDPGRRLRIDGDWFEIQTGVWHKNRPLIKLAGVDSIEAAELLRWKVLESIALEDFEEDTFRIGDLLDCRVITTDGEDLGILDEVIPMPAQDLYRVGDILIPGVKEFVKEIDLDAKKITVELIPGMRGEEVE